ncbi:MAG: OmpA family protein, partial [Treponema sp.]|nr:OmpA family protein [Treponema sp.]
SILSFCLFSETSTFESNSQDRITISYKGSPSYFFTERTDLRRYDNGKYVGLTSREVKAYILAEENKSQDVFCYDGNFYVLEKTVRSLKNVSPTFNDAIPSVFEISKEGELFMKEDNGYPSFRSFPSFPKTKIKIGDSWEAVATRTVDPLNKSVFTRIPLYIRYTYLKDEVRDGEEVYLIKAEWATRYGNAIIQKEGDETPRFDVAGDPLLVSATGRHSATMHISKKTGRAIVIRDSVDETFSYKDGKNIQFKGTISLFTEYPPFVEKEKIIPVVEKVPEVRQEPSSSGLKIILENLRFKADSAELLQGEEERLDRIAASLKLASASLFLVEGHTASTGNERGEKQLSLERAHSIVEELTKRGISMEKFICKGSGSEKPIATNDSPDGRAKNRRVEITILE